MSARMHVLAIAGFVTVTPLMLLIYALTNEVMWSLVWVSAACLVTVVDWAIRGEKSV